MATSPDALAAAVAAALGDALESVGVALGEVTAVVRADRLADSMRTLRDWPEFAFATLIDASGVDYLSYGDGVREGPRYAVVYQPVTIEPREVTPRVIREDSYAGADGFRKG